MDDYRLDPDYDVNAGNRAFYCDNCEGPIYYGDSYYEMQDGRAYLMLCPDCAKAFFEDCRRTAERWEG